MALTGLWLVSVGVSAQVGPPSVLVLPAASYLDTREYVNLANMTAAFQPGSGFYDLWLRASSGQITAWNVLVRPYVTYTSPPNPPLSGCSNANESPLHQYARQQAINAGIDINAYERKVYLVPPCGAASGRSTGASITLFGGGFSLPHEFGHSFGVAGEGQAMVCFDAVCADDPGSLNFQMVNYSDPYSVMGGSGNSGVPGLFERQIMRVRANGPAFLSPTRAPIITADGVFTIAHVDTPTGQIGIVVVDPTGSTVQGGFGKEVVGVELRSTGVILRYAWSMLPTGQGRYYPLPFLLMDLNPFAGGNQSLLAQGQSFAWRGITFTPETVSATTATIRVSGLGSTGLPMGVSNLRAD